MTSPPFMEVPQMLKLSAYLCDLREEISDDENLIGLENWGGNREQTCSASKLKCYQEKWMCMTVTKNGTLL